MVVGPLPRQRRSALGTLRPSRECMLCPRADGVSESLSLMVSRLCDGESPSLLGIVYDANHCVSYCHLRAMPSQASRSPMINTSA